MCIAGLVGVGDASLGQWEHDGDTPNVVHVQRRLSLAEQDAYAVPDPYDVRGTPEETSRVTRVALEAPHLFTRRRT